MTEIKPGWLNKKDMAASLGISVQGFDKWGVKPVAKVGRQVFFDCRSVLDNREEHRQQPPQPTTTGLPEGIQVSDEQQTYEQYRLTKARADAQELENERKRKLVIDTEFATFALSKIAAEIASTLDTIPLNQKRKHPEYTTQQLEDLKRDIVKAQNTAARLDDRLPDFLDEYISGTS